MAIIFLQKRKNQTMLVFIFLGIAAIIAFIWWFGYFKKGKEEPPPGEQAAFMPEDEIEIDFEVLKNPLVKELQLFPEIQPLASSTDSGRLNPFLPY